MKLSPFIREVVNEIREGCNAAHARPVRLVEMEINLGQDGSTLAKLNDDTACRISLSIVVSTITPLATSLSPVEENHYPLDQ